VTAGREPVGLLLAPGAGAGRDQATLVAIDRALTGEGVAVARMDFAYRRAGRRAPDRPAVLVAAVIAEAAALSVSAGVAPANVFVGGRSMGGRMCSMAVAEGLVARGVVLISYPLHPPGRPERLRTEHFGALDVPCLFVSGTRDAFATPSELVDASSAIPGPVTHHWVEGKDHGLRGADPEVTAVVASWVIRWRRQG
jgi:uncharacterized protein